MQNPHAASERSATVSPVPQHSPASSVFSESSGTAFDAFSPPLTFRFSDGTAAVAGSYSSTSQSSVHTFSPTAPAQFSSAPEYHTFGTASSHVQRQASNNDTAAATWTPSAVVTAAEPVEEGNDDDARAAPAVSRSELGTMSIMKLHSSYAAAADTALVLKTAKLGQVTSHGGVYRSLSSPAAAATTESHALCRHPGATSSRNRRNSAVAGAFSCKQEVPLAAPVPTPAVECEVSSTEAKALRTRAANYFGQQRGTTENIMHSAQLSCDVLPLRPFAEACPRKHDHITSRHFASFSSCTPPSTRSYAASFYRTDITPAESSARKGGRAPHAAISAVHLCNSETAAHKAVCAAPACDDASPRYSSVSTGMLTEPKRICSSTCRKHHPRKQLFASQATNRSPSRSSTAVPSVLCSVEECGGNNAAAGGAVRDPSRRSSGKRSSRTLCEDTGTDKSGSSESEDSTFGSPFYVAASRVKPTPPGTRWNFFPFRLMLGSCFSAPCAPKQRRSSSTSIRAGSAVNGERFVNECTDSDEYPRTRRSSLLQKFSPRSSDSSCVYGRSLSARGNASELHCKTAAGASYAAADPPLGTPKAPPSVSSEHVPQQLHTCTTATMCFSASKLDQVKPCKSGKGNHSKRIIRLVSELVGGKHMPYADAARYTHTETFRGQDVSVNDSSIVMGENKTDVDDRAHELKEQRGHIQRQKRPEHQQGPQEQNSASDTAVTRCSASTAKETVSHQQGGSFSSPRSFPAIEEHESASCKTGGTIASRCFGWAAGQQKNRDGCAAPVGRSSSSISSHPGSHSSSSPTSSTCFGGIHVRNLVMKCGSIVCVLPDDDEDMLEEREEWEATRVRRSEEEANGRLEGAALPCIGNESFSCFEGAARPYREEAEAPRRAESSYTRHEGRAGRKCEELRFHIEDTVVHTYGIPAPGGERPYRCSG